MSAVQLYQPAPQALPMAPAETAASALASQAKAITEARYLVAINRPRDMDSVRQSLLKECQRPGFAEVARYRKPVGKGIEGLSIRFVEAAIRCMRNIVVETLTVYDDREKRIVHVSVTDLETNVPYSQSITIRKAVERRSPREGDTVLSSRTNSNGHPVYLVEATDDEILNTQNALVSKAIRTLGLRLIPGDLQDEAEAEILDTLQKKDAQDPDAARKRIFDAFQGVGVAPAQVKEYLSHEAATLNPAELAELRAVYQAVKDGETTWRDVMENRRGQEEKAQQKQQPAGSRRGADGLKSAIKRDSPKTEPGQPSLPVAE